MLQYPYLTSWHMLIQIVNYLVTMWREASLAERLDLMLVRSGDLWHCTNPACLSELSIGTSGDVEVDRVYCVCDAVMKKHYKPPVFRYLDFIGEHEQDALQVLAPDLLLQDARKE